MPRLSRMVLSASLRRALDLPRLEARAREALDRRAARDAGLAFGAARRDRLAARAEAANGRTLGRGGGARRAGRRLRVADLDLPGLDRVAPGRGTEVLHAHGFSFGVVRGRVP